MIAFKSHRPIKTNFGYLNKSTHEDWWKVFWVSNSIRHFKDEKGTRAEKCPAIASGIVTGEASVDYWPIFFPVPRNSPRSLCESQLDPVFFYFLKQREGNWSRNVSRDWFWDRYWGCAVHLLANFSLVPRNSPSFPLWKSTRSSLFLFSKVANSVIFPLVAKKYISFKYKIKEHLPRLLWTWYPLESEQAPRYPTCYLEKWRVPEEECPQDLSEVACYHCNI